MWADLYYASKITLCMYTVIVVLYIQIKIKTSQGKTLCLQFFIYVVRYLFRIGKKL